MNVDTESQNNINIPKGCWARADNVRIEQDRLWYALRKDAYELEQSYRLFPHITFMNVKTDAELIDFVRTWGPLRLLGLKIKHNEGFMPLNRLWSEQKWLRAFAQLVRSFRERRDERRSLREFLAASDERQQAVLPGSVASEIVFALPFLGTALAEVTADGSGFGPNGRDGCLERADSSALREATAYLIEHAVPVTATVEADWRSRPARIRARWGIDCLEDALEWMVLQDELDEKPVRFCAEESCGAAFRPSNGHHTRFCSPECGHRATARKWARENRQKAKRESGRARSSHRTRP